MMLTLKQICPHCKSSSISRKDIIVSDILWKEIKCPVCSESSSHPTWFRKLLILYFIFGAVLAYALSYSPSIHYYRPAHFLIAASGVAIAGLISVAVIPLSGKRASLPLGGGIRVSLWTGWCSFVVAILGVSAIEIMQGKKFEADILKIHVSLGNLLFYFGIFLWITWEALSEEVRRLYRRK